MSPLFLHCTLCGRKQAEGLLSRGLWGHAQLENGTAVSACPACKAADPDWDLRVRATLTRDEQSSAGRAP